MNIVNPLKDKYIENLFSIFQDQLSYKERIKLTSKYTTEAYKFNCSLNNNLMYNPLQIRYFIRELNRFNQLVLIPITFEKFFKFFPSYKVPSNQVVTMSAFQLVRNLVRTHKTFEINYKSPYISEEMFFKYNFKIKPEGILPLLYNNHLNSSVLHNFSYIIKYPSILFNKNIACFHTKFIFIVFDYNTHYNIDLNDLKDNLFLIKLCENFRLYDYLCKEYEKSPSNESKIIKMFNICIPKAHYEAYIDFMEFTEGDLLYG